MIKKSVFKFATLICGIITLASLSSCSSDSNDDDNGTTKCNEVSYNLVLQVPDECVDQADIVKTVVLVKNSVNGKVLQETEVDLSKGESIVSPAESITSLPFEGVIEVNQTIKEGADLSNKDKICRVGLKIAISITSLSKNKEIIATKVTGSSSSSAQYSTNISESFPKLSSFKFKVDESGNIKLF